MDYETIKFHLANYGNTITTEDPKHIKLNLLADGFVCNFVCLGDHWLINLERQTKPYKHLIVADEPHPYRYSTNSYKYVDSY